MASSQPKSPSKKNAETNSENAKTKKLMKVKIDFLDETSHIFQIQSKALGQSLFEKVCKYLKLLETDYFGLEYEDENKTKYWIDRLKPLCRQVGIATTKPSFTFQVKFYTPDPAQLEDEFTRYLFSLQLKRDLALGDLQCNDNTAAVMISYIVQAHIGDFEAEIYPNHTYLSSYKFVPFQDQELEVKIMENHKKHVGQTQAEAESNLLETARRCELYGIKMTAAKDQEGVPLNLAVAHLGVLVFQNYTKINIFSWAKIRKLSFKRKQFLIKLHPEGYGYYKDTVSFYFEGRNECKNFWKKCIENHTFFRCSDAKKGMRQKPKFFSRGSSFRYSGRTQVQVSEFVRENYIKRNFQRSTSLNTSSGSPSRSGVGSGSVSPQPVLPVSYSSESVKNVPDVDKASPPLKKLSSSEPTTPNGAQDAPDDGSFAEDEPRNGIKSVTSPDSDCRDFQSPDYLGQDEEDNTSHDSYHVSEKEQKSTAVNGSARNDDILYNHNTPKITKALPPKAILNNNENIENNNFSPKSNGLLSNVQLTPEVFNDCGYVSLMDSRFSKKLPTDKAYHIAKELLMSERTYRRDLEIINVVFREEFNKQGDMPHEPVDSMLNSIDPLHEVHCSILRDLEQRLAFWEGKRTKLDQNSSKGVGDIFVKHKRLTSVYETYVCQVMQVLEGLYTTLQTNQRFTAFYQQFEAHKICYLPMTSLLVKSLFRLAQYSDLLEALASYYGKTNLDFDDCRVSATEFRKTFSLFGSKITPIVNFVKLMELERNLVRFPNYFKTGRMFIREGCVQRLLDDNNNNQIMMFLFSDVLLFTKQIQTGKLLFKVQASVPLAHLTVDELKASPDAGHFRFAVRAGRDQSLTLATTSKREREKWTADLREAVGNVASGTLSQLSLDDFDDDDDDFRIVNNEEKSTSHHINTSVHVCWQRNLSIGKCDLLVSARYSLSGFLLRRFSNNSGWQKLWVVLSNLCLFFYKSYLDESPLASLPLAGYRVSNPGPEDDVTKDLVFKLQYKNHAYFFRAESAYHFDRWFELINLSTLAINEEKTHL